MTEVYINQQRAYPKEDSNLKLTIENTLFENSGSYTLDVIFPLDIDESTPKSVCKDFTYQNVTKYI